MSKRLRRATVVIAAAATTVGVLAGVSYAAGTHWTVEPTPVPHAPSGSLTSVSCDPLTPGERCVAVGTSLAADGTTTSLTLVGDGSSWQVAGSPRRRDAASTTLTAVSCVRANLCFAVGEDTPRGGNGARSFAARWDGGSWFVLPTPNPVTGDDATVELSAVSCASAIRCVAVGNYFTTQTVPITPLVLSWNGQAWTQAAAGMPTGATRAHLDGVDCPTARRCVAVGSQTDTAQRHAPLTGQVDGSAVTYGSAPTRDDGAELSAVSCTSISACTAVGHSDGGDGDDTLVEMLAAGHWAIVGSPNARGIENDLTSVSCTSPDSCLAVGETTPYNKGLTLAERWDGTSWEISPSPNGAVDNYTAFTGVSCVADEDCVAVGWRYVYTDPGQSFSARWQGGQWSVLPGGNAVGLEPDSFAATSCPSTTSCVAVGAAVATTKHEHIFAEQRDTAGWTIAALPAISDASDSALNSVSCPAAGECMAVGWTADARYGGGRTQRALALQLHDGTWTQLSTADAPRGVQLAGVACPTRTFCAAVGAYGDPAAMIYDGTSWHDSTLPSPGQGDLTAVSCSAADRCLAVGYLYTETGRTIAVGYEWSGTTWSDASAGMAGQAQSVSCTSATFCMAVGFTGSGGVPLAESWDGTAWTQLSPAPSGTGVFLSVSCVTAQNCVAVGQRYPGSPAELVQQWNGTRWLLRTDVQQTGSATAVLNGVSCASTTTCVAVGDRGTSYPAPLVESTSG